MQTTRRRARFVVLIAVLSLAGLLVGAPPAAAEPGATSTVFINELHYDNDGGDVGEAIEIAGPAGTDLTGWQIVRYNGNGGTVYGTDTLSVTLTDQSGGYGFFTQTYPANGLQNGSPDGIALIDPVGTVVQFLSYEGSFAAVEGPATGVTSSDIGVAESGATAIGESLQLAGAGITAADFTWSAAAASTFDAANTGQSFGGGGGGGGPAAPVINEWGISDASTDNEFVEIYGDANTDYSAYTVIQVDGTSGDGAIDHVVPVGTTDGNGIWAATLAANAFENGSSTLLLVEDFTGADGDDLDTDGDGTLDVEPWTAVVDAVATDGGDAGATFYGVPVLDESFDDARFDSTFSPGGGSRIPDGTDTDTAADWFRNDFDWDGATNGSPEVGEALNTPGAPNQLATGPVPAVLVNEVDADQDGTDAAEFVELTAAAGTALDGLVLVLFNGNGDSSYQAFDLDGQTTSADGYFVLCGNAATTANCDLDVSPDTNLVQNGADAAALYVGDAGDFPNGTAVTTDGLVDAIVYDTNDADDAGLLTLLTAGGQVNEGANGDQIGESNSRCPDGSGTGRDTTPYVATSPTPGAANDCGGGGGGGGGDPVLISQIQGSGPTVAISGPVEVQAVVTSLFEDDDALDGFFIQEEDTQADGDPATSEGIFVFCRGACPAGLAVGDLVTVNGNATDFFGMSQIDAGAGAGGGTVIDSSGNPLPAATPLSLPASGSTLAEATFESTEGMIVSFSDTLVVSEYFQLARFGQLVLTDEARPEQFTDANAPDVAGYAAFLDDLATRRIILDDNNNDQNDRTSGPLDNEPYAWPVGGLSTTNFVRGGDTIAGLTGVMHWSFPGTGDNTWRLRPIDGQDYTFTAANPRPAAPADVGGDLTVASFNVLNYFTTLDEPGATCGPSALGCRGAHSAAELQRQKDKIVSAIGAMDADIVGIIEVENDGGASVADLVSGLNAAVGAGTYDYVDTGAIGGDAIKVGFIYQPGSVTPVGDFAILDSSVDPTFIDDKNRPVLIQTFEDSNGARVTVAVNHFKSKGSPCDDVGDPNANDGQANCNGTRTAASVALANYLATDPTGSGDDDFLIIGDLNAYAMEDPITALEAAGYTDLVEQFVGSDAYSFVFDGQLGYLDHALANAALLPQVTGVTTWHINADEVNLLDYNDDIQDAAEASFERESNATDLYDPDAFRSSDHDPVLIGIDPALSCGGVSGTAAQLAAAGYNVIIGTDGPDEIIGTQGADFILGRGGSDEINGLRGDDVICGGSGDDEVRGNNGDDIIDGGAGDDDIRGNGGDDVIFGGAGDDQLTGNGGSDACDGGSHADGDSASGCETILNVP